MVTMETDVEELLGLVIHTGREIDDAVSQLHTMSEVVKRGVLQAQDELQKESENQIWQEGILRLYTDNNINNNDISNNRYNNLININNKTILTYNICFRQQKNIVTTSIHNGNVNDDNSWQQKSNNDNKTITANMRICKKNFTINFELCVLQTCPYRG